MTATPLTVDAGWLARHLDDPGLRIIDASFHLPSSGRDATAEYQQCHIPGAIRFDVDAIADTGSPLPHMLPTAERFGEMVGALGIGNQHHVIAYDSIGIFSAPRAWWSFRAMGHERVSVLDGGLKSWLDHGHPVSNQPVVYQPVGFVATRQTGMVLDRNRVEQIARENSAQILDARGRARFTAEGPEAWPGRRAGHIPGSLNLPIDRLVDENTGRFKALSDIDAEIHAAGITPDQPIVTSCGSGVTAAVLSMALAMTGRWDVGLYDGSWAEWGLPDGPPIETGPPRNEQAGTTPPG